MPGTRKICSVFRKLMLSHDTGFGTGNLRLLLKTIMNAVEKHKSFVFSEARLNGFFDILSDSAIEGIQCACSTLGLLSDEC